MLGKHLSGWDLRNNIELPESRVQVRFCTVSFGLDGVVKDLPPLIVLRCEEIEEWVETPEDETMIAVCVDLVHHFLFQETEVDHHIFLLALLVEGFRPTDRLDSIAMPV
jgi:hypothetical protein